MDSRCVHYSGGGASFSVILLPSNFRGFPLAGVPTQSCNNMLYPTWVVGLPVGIFCFTGSQPSLSGEL